MQIHGPSDHLHDGNRIYAELNPGTQSGSPFVDMHIGQVRLYIDTPEECDWLIAAAVEAKRLLSPPPQGSHPYPVDQEHGFPSWCPAFTTLDGEDVTVYCDRDPGHAGAGS